GSCTVTRRMPGALCTNNLVSRSISAIWKGVCDKEEDGRALDLGGGLWTPAASLQRQFARAQYRDLPSFLSRGAGRLRTLCGRRFRRAQDRRRGGTAPRGPRVRCSSLVPATRRRRGARPGRGAASPGARPGVHRGESQALGGEGLKARNATRPWLARSNGGGPGRLRGGRRRGERAGEDEMSKREWVSGLDEYKDSEEQN